MSILISASEKDFQSAVSLYTAITTIQIAVLPFLQPLILLLHSIPIKRKTFLSCEPDTKIFATYNTNFHDCLWYWLFS